jgi:Holliday junction resolvase RusA-like endonuclease
LDKLIRAAGDALTGIVYTDDAAITHITAHKRLAEPTETPGVHISIGTLL